LGLVTTFNLIYLLNIALSGYAAWLLVRRLTGRDPESWLAGALFAASPVLIARGTAHFSLVAAAPLPLFLLLFRESVLTGSVRYGMAAGATVAWATFCDAYYGVYCVLLGCLALAMGSLEVTRLAAHARPRLAIATRTLELLIVIVAAFVAGIWLRGGGPIVFLGIRVSMRTLYTPMLVLSILVLIRAIIALGTRVAIRARWRQVPLGPALFAAALIGMVLLSPVLYGVGHRLLSDQSSIAPTYWRSSPPGVDLLSFVMPNPNHPAWGGPMRETIARWSGRADGFPEFVAALSWVALGVIVFVWRASSWRPPGFWTVLTVGAGLLALGPFVHVASVNTLLPTPWTFLRYMPIVGLARSPSRFTVVVSLGLCVLFGLALAALTRDRPERRRVLLAVVTMLLVLELVPVPRPLYSAEIPHIYRRIAADPRPVRVLELPFGVRDGASSIGSYSAFSQFCQTAHGKALIGGYLSRVSRQRQRSYRRVPVLDALMTLSEHRPLSAAQDRRARASADQFLARAQLGYLVVDTSRASSELLRFAEEIFGMRKIDEDGSRVLYVPREPAGDQYFGDRPAFLGPNSN
jgi:hypothetical protein